MDEYIRRDALIAEFERLSLGENSLVEKFFAHGVYAVIETFPAAKVRALDKKKYVPVAKAVSEDAYFTMPDGERIHRCASKSRRRW